MLYEVITHAGPAGHDPGSRLRQGRTRRPGDAGGKAAGSFTGHQAAVAVIQGAAAESHRKLETDQRKTAVQYRSGYP